MMGVKVALFALSISIMSLQGGPGYRVETRYPVPGNGGFDYLSIDSKTRRLYLSHGTQVDVVDADSGRLIGTIPDTPGVHGIAIAAEVKHGFTSNGREDKVSVFDLATLKLIKKVDVGKGPDGIYYDPESKRVFTNNHRSHDITAIDARTGDVVGTVPMEGDGEQAVIAGNLIYVNSENTNEVVTFDPKSLDVKHRFPIGIAQTPTGLAYDAQTKRLFVGCRNEPKMVVMDAVTGKVLNSFPPVDDAGQESRFT
jgi:YVTN family beta-propeller protein